MTGTIGKRISEFHHGKPHAKTNAKGGKKAAAAGRSIGDIYRSMSKKK